MEKLNNILMDVGSWFGNNKYFSSLQKAFAVNMPFIIVGSISLIFSSVILSPTMGLAAFDSLSGLEQYGEIFKKINFVSVNLISILIVLLSAKFLAERNKVNSNIAMIVAFLSFIIMIPTDMVVSLEKETMVISNILEGSNLSAQSLFLGIIVAFISVELFSNLYTNKKLRITMPDSIPPAIADSFASIFPIFITLLIFSSLNFITLELIGKNWTEIIYDILQAPLQNVMQKPYGILVIVFASQLFWLIGLHGANITAPIREPLLIAAISTNMTLFSEGLKPIEVISKPFWNIFAATGGSGATIGLLIAIFLFSKREDHKAVAKLSLAPGIFGINEPLIFGLPLVLNPVFAIPFLVAPLVTTGIGFASTYLNFAGKMVLDIPWNTPLFLNAFIATGGSIGAVITQVVIVIVSTLIYSPFVLMANKQVDMDN